MSSVIYSYETFFQNNAWSEKLNFVDAKAGWNKK